MRTKADRRHARDAARKHDELKALVGVDPTDVDMAELQARLVLKPPRVRREIARRCVNRLEVLRLPSTRYVLGRLDEWLAQSRPAEQLEHIARCKCLLALLPDTEDFLARVLSGPEDRELAEARFTLLCYVDELVYMRRVAAFRRRLPELLITYLLSMRRDYGRVGHMIWRTFEDWPDRHVATLALIRGAKEARYASAREIALRGLTVAVEHERSNEATRSLMAVAAHAIMRDDRSARVRRSARELLTLL